MPREPFSWDAAMAAGLGALRLTPDAFWAMTPRELDATLRGAFGIGPSQPMTRAEFSALTALYPDT